MLDLNGSYALSENVILREMHDKFWCLDTLRGTQYRLNRVSFDLLSGLDGVKPLASVIDEAGKRYDVDSDVFMHDAEELLVSAEKKNLMERKC